MGEDLSEVGRSLCVVPSGDVYRGIVPFWVQEAVVMKAGGRAGTSDDDAQAWVWVTMAFRWRRDEWSLGDKAETPILGVLHPGKIKDLQDQSETLLNKSFWLNEVTSKTRRREYTVNEKDRTITLFHKTRHLDDLAVDSAFDPDQYPVENIKPLSLQVHEDCVPDEGGKGNVAEIYSVAPDSEAPAMVIVLSEECKQGEVRDFICRWSFRTKEVKKNEREVQFPVFGTRRTLKWILQKLREECKTWKSEVKVLFFEKLLPHVTHTLFDVVMVGNPSSYIYDVDLGNEYRHTEAFLLESFEDPDYNKDEKVTPVVFSFTPEASDFLINLRAWEVKSEKVKG